mgnify:FL=1
MVSLILLIISVLSISCAYIIQYNSPILGNLGQALPEHFVAILLIFTLIFSVAGIIMCFVERKRKHATGLLWYVKVIVFSVLSVYLTGVVAIGTFWGLLFRC